jgi:hypothetical protein
MKPFAWLENVDPLMRRVNSQLPRLLGRLPWAWVWGAVAAAGAVALLPLLALLPFSLPMADDFCMPRHLHNMGLLDLGGWVYLNWSGRILSHILIALPGAVMLEGWLSFRHALVLGNAVLVGLVGLSLLAMVQLALPPMARAGRRWLAAVVIAATSLGWLAWHLPSARDAWFWYAAGVTYTVMIPFFVVSFLGLASVLWARGGWLLLSVPVTAASLVAMGSLNELAALLALGTTGVVALAARANRQWCLWLLVGVALLALLVVLGAPGNAVRTAASTAPMPLMVAIAGGLPLGIGWLLNTLNVAMAVWLLCVALLVRQHGGNLQFWRLWALVAAPLLGLVLLAPVVGLFANGESLPMRTLNQLYFQLWFGLTGLVGWLSLRTREKPQCWAGLDQPWLKLAPLTLAVSVVCEPGLIRAVNDVRRGPALVAAFDAREALLAEAQRTGQTVGVPPLGAIPKTIYEETLQPANGTWQSSCIAGWYRVPGVYLISN